MIDLLVLRICWHTISFAILESGGNLIEFEVYSVEDLYTSLLCDLHDYPCCFYWNLDWKWKRKCMEAVAWIRNLWVDTYAVEQPDGRYRYPSQGF